MSLADSLAPHPSELDDHLHGLIHVLRRHPLEPRVEVVLAGEEIRRRQPHERQARAVGAAADRPLDRLEAGAADRVARAARRRAGMRSSTSRMLRYDSSTASSTARPGLRRPPRARAARRAPPSLSVPRSRSRAQHLDAGPIDRRLASGTDGDSPRSPRSSPATALARQRVDEVAPRAWIAFTIRPFA